MPSRGAVRLEAQAARRGGADAERRGGAGCRPIQVHEARRSMDWTGSRHEGAREDRSTDHAGSRADARALRVLLPQAPPDGSAHADRVLVVRQPWFDKDFSEEEATHMCTEAWDRCGGKKSRPTIPSKWCRSSWPGRRESGRWRDALGVEQLDLMPCWIAASPPTTTASISRPQDPGSSPPPSRPQSCDSLFLPRVRQRRLEDAIAGNLACGLPERFHAE
jgi:hypothetical protein